VSLVFVIIIIILITTLFAQLLPRGFTIQGTRLGFFFSLEDEQEDSNPGCLDPGGRGDGGTKATRAESGSVGFGGQRHSWPSPW